MPSNLVRTKADYHPCPEGNAMCNHQQTLTELLDDPMIQAVMKADRVDPAELKAVLAALTNRLQPPRPTEAILDCIGWGEPSW